MAAATSIDAYVPVMLALAKLSMLYFSPEYLSEVRKNNNFLYVFTC